MNNEFNQDNDLINSNPINIIIAGGGTGGHLFPGIAIAQAFLEKCREAQILFVITGKPFEVNILDQLGFKWKKIHAAGIKGKGLWQKFKSFNTIPKGIFESFKILRHFKANVVVGMGSYTSFPVAIAARLMKVKLALHEQNSLPGITNRILGHIANRIYISFPDIHNFFNPKKILLSGNPIRKEILLSFKDSEILENNKKPFTVLIIGGSQGAHSINMAMVDTINHLGKTSDFLFIHQTGAADEEQVKKYYEEKKVACVVKPFFNDMSTQYKNADLIICRAGATTVAELTVLGKAAVFIPFPFAADNHQVLNAKSLVNSGAAEMILQQNLSGEVLAQRIEYYKNNPQSLIEMESKAKLFGKPDASRTITEDILLTLNT